MKASDGPAKIMLSTLQTHLVSYDSFVPPKIAGLEELRLSTIPETLAKRKEDGDAFLEKTEVTSLVEWKLKHGTYRPNLAKLVSSNSVGEVRSTTRSAFSIYEADNADYAKSITTLSKLKGIGPATASLLLSCYDPIKVPFFSDELFRYLHWEEAKSKGWDRKINYTAKEYKELFSRLQILQTRIEMDSKQTVSAIDIEKMAYVLGKSATSTTHFPEDAEDAEGDAALRPPSPKRRKRSSKSDANSDSDDSIPLGIRQVEECRRKGLDGSPTYDELGFELDKEYIIKRTGGRPRPLGKRAIEKFEQEGKDRERKADILGVENASQRGDIRNERVWDNLVAKDLGMAFHEVGMEEYEEWKKRRFKTRAVEYKDLRKEEQERLLNLTSGSALRKGSKRR